MIRLLDDIEGAYPRLDMGTVSPPATAHGVPESRLPYSPAPAPSGHLTVDPEVALPSPGMEVEIAYFYSAVSTDNGAFGYARTISPNLYATATPTPSLVTFARGDGSLVSYVETGSGTNLFNCSTPGVFNTLSKVASTWQESTPDAVSFVYPLDTTGARSTITYAQDAVGNRHTFSYSGGYLSTLQDALGRLVTFGYSGNLLSYIRDWADRRITFQYDTVTANPKNLMTTVTGATGCVTVYGYDLISLSGSTDWLLTSVTDPMGYQTTYDYDYFRRTTQRAVVGAGIWTYLYGPARQTIVEPNFAFTTLTLDSNFDILTRTDPKAVTTTMTYSNRQRTSYEDMLGNFLTWTYSGAGKPTGFTDSVGNRTTLQYDVYNNPTTLQYANNAIASLVWGYGGSGFDTTGVKRRLQAWVDPQGSRTSLSYDGRGELTEIQDALGYRSSLVYDAQWNVKNFIDARNYRATYTYDLAGNPLTQQDPLGYTLTATYDPSDRLLTWQDGNGYLTSFVYDSLELLSRQIDPRGFVTSFQYNVFDLPKQFQDALGYVTTLAYTNTGLLQSVQDANGNFATYLYDSASRLTTVQDPLANLTTLGYDASGRTKYFQDALGNVTTATYQGMDRLRAVTNALGQIATYNYDSLDRILSVQDTLGNFTTLGYDGAGNLQNITNPLNFITTAAYDAVEQLKSFQNPRGYLSTYSYDPTGNLTGIQDAAGYRVTATFDPRGLLSVLQNGVGVSTHYTFDGAQNWTGYQDGRNFQWSATYDGLGQVVGTLDPLNYRATYSYDGAGQLLTSQDQSGYVTSFAYTPTGMTKSVQDAKGNFTSYAYTVRDEVKSRQNMIGAYNTYTYNALGNPSLFTDRMSRVQTFTFDRLSRLTYLAYTDGNYTSLSYDGLSRLSGMQDTTGVRTHSYDNASRVTGVVYPTSVRLTYGYDANDNRTSLQALSQTTSYSCDSRDLLSSQVNGLNERTTYSYDGEGRESLRQTANGVRVSTSYDNNGGVSLKQYWNSANAALAIYSGTYSRREQLSNQAELGTYPASYTYYANYQLGHDYRGSEQVNNFYDGVGNLSSRDNAGTTNYTYNSLNQMVTAVIGSSRTTLAYDLEGNMTSEIVGASYTTFSYDAMNRLTTVNKDGTSESYVYSADGLRQQKTAGGSTIDYVWDGQNVLVETNTSLVVQASYVDYPGIWGGLVSQNRSGTSNWYGFDIEGNTRILVSVGGVVTDSYSYRAFGEETGGRGSTVNAYRFGGVVGYYRDSATREYLRQRHYRSDLSRFVSQDPIGFAGGDVNLYRYTRNRPTNFVDPSGKDVWIIVWPGDPFGSHAGIAVSWPGEKLPRAFDFGPGDPLEGGLPNNAMWYLGWGFNSPGELMAPLPFDPEYPWVPSHNDSAILSYPLRDKPDFANKIFTNGPDTVIRVPTNPAQDRRIRKWLLGNISNEDNNWTGNYGRYHGQEHQCAHHVLDALRAAKTINLSDYEPQKLIISISLGPPVNLLEDVVTPFALRDWALKQPGRKVSQTHPAYKFPSLGMIYPGRPPYLPPFKR